MQKRFNHCYRKHYDGLVFAHMDSMVLQLVGKDNTF